MDLIIGAGITGLSYALFRKNHDYIIFEKEKTIGGYCRTTKRNGYVWDYSGHFFHFRDPDIKKVIMGALPVEDTVNVVKQTSIRYGDRLIDFPFQNNIHQLPKEEFIQCLVDLFSAEDKGNYSSFKEMLYEKFGRGIAEKFLIPYNEKLYACDLDTLDHDAMGRFFPYVDKEDIVKGFRNSQRVSYNSSFLYPKGGAIEYVKAIESQLESERIIVDREIDYVDMDAKVAVTKDGVRVAYDNLISTIPLPFLLDICGVPYPEELFSWNKVLVFNLGFDRKGPERSNHWLYFPEKKYSFYRVGFYDNILTTDKSSLYVGLGFHKDDEINVEEMRNKVLEDLLRANIISENMTLIDHECIIMNPAYVHINTSSQEYVKAIKEQLSKKSVYSIGRYGSWTYCSIEDNVKEAKELSHYISQQ